MRNEFRTEPKGDTLAQKKKISRHARSLVRNFNKQIHTTAWAEIVRKDIIPAPNNIGWNAKFWVTFRDKLDTRNARTVMYDYPNLIKKFSAE